MEASGGKDIAETESKKKPTGLGLGSDRRGFQLMAAQDGDESVMVVRSVYGKTRPLTEDGAFGDRAPPQRPAPPGLSSKPATPAVAVAPTTVGEGSAGAASKPAPTQMPYVYASAETGLVLTRGQYLDLKGAAEQKKAREAAREENSKEGDALLELWKCDPR